MCFVRSKGAMLGWVKKGYITQVNRLNNIVLLHVGTHLASLCVQISCLSVTYYVVIIRKFYLCLIFVIIWIVEADLDY